MEINISSLFLALKYVKYYCLGENPKNSFQSDLRLSICHNNLEVKLAFSAFFFILGPSNFLFLAQIIPLYSKSSILSRKLQLTPNLGIKCSYSNKHHKNVKKYKFIN